MSILQAQAGLRAHLLALCPGFVTSQIERALTDAENDGFLISFTENGMTDPTPDGQRIEDAAARTAKADFMRVLDGYLAVSAGFDPLGPYLDEAAHAGNEYKGAYSASAQDVLERLVDAHAEWLRYKNEPAATESVKDGLRFLLKAPLEFADANSAEFLTPQEQARFSIILTKLRQQAAL